MLRLAGPVVVVQVGLMFMGVVDMLMVGRVSAQAIAAVAMGNLYFYSASIFGVGTLLALDPIVAQAVGARDDAAIARAVQRGLLIAAGLTLVSSLALLGAEPVLRALRQPADVVPLAGAYCRVVMPGMLPFFVFVVFRQTLQARHRVAPIVAAIVVANLVNAGLNWVFIFGHLGFAAHGVVGSGMATMLSRWLLPVMLLASSWRELSPSLQPWRPRYLESRCPGPHAGARPADRRADGARVRCVRGGRIDDGWIGTVTLAGHQVALNLASLTFMVPVGVAAAASVLVGNAIGRGDMPEARRAAAAGLVCGVTFMAASATLMLLVPGFFARLYTSDRAVAAVAASLIPIAGVFQIFDGTQVVSIGILRGAGDTRMPMLINILGFWLMGLPVSWWLGIRMGLGPAGLWWGLTTGLVVVASFLLLRVRWRLRGEVGRVRIDR